MKRCLLDRSDRRTRCVAASQILSARDYAARKNERGVTMIFVAVAMIAIISMAALSIDVITLYLAREEAQRSADSAALAAAHILSVSGITGTATPSTDTASWSKICGPDDGVNGFATRTAEAVGAQNSVGSQAATVTVTYSAGGVGPVADCTSLPTAFGVNPLITVKVQQTNLPTFFSRIWGNSGNTVSAIATAEAFNPSNSGNVDNGPTGTITPVQPRCVKPWIVPNRDPLNPRPSGGGYCDQGGGACNTFVSAADGSITHAGLSINGNGLTGIIGETFWLGTDCRFNGSTCRLRVNPPVGNYPGTGNPHIPPQPSVQYLPAQTLNASTAVPACSVSTSLYEHAIEGCDQNASYQCGVPVASTTDTIDLSENPAFSGDSTNGVKCLIHENDATTSQPDGQDTLNPYAAPASYPYQILAGTSNPLSALAGKSITNSNSIVSLPIFDGNGGAGNSGIVNAAGTTTVTFVGFLQVFINAVDPYGNINVTVLNVSGCGNGSNATGAPVKGASTVPTRLITYP